MAYQRENLLSTQIDSLVSDRNSFKQLASSILSNDFNVKKMFRSEYEKERFDSEMKKLDSDIAVKKRKKQIEKMKPDIQNDGISVDSSDFESYSRADIKTPHKIKSTLMNKNLSSEYNLKKSSYYYNNIENNNKHFKDNLYIYFKNYKN